MPEHTAVPADGACAEPPCRHWHVWVDTPGLGWLRAGPQPSKPTVFVDKAQAFTRDEALRLTAAASASWDRRFGLPSCLAVHIPPGAAPEAELPGRAAGAPSCCPCHSAGAAVP